MKDLDETNELFSSDTLNDMEMEEASGGNSGNHFGNKCNCGTYSGNCVSGCACGSGSN